MLGKSVLVVDDEKKIVDILKSFLERDGYTVLVAHDGRTALDVARRRKPDAVILDLLLPELDGLEVCRRIRAESQVPVIMLTAKADEADKLIGLELGADDYVTKPFSPKEVVARVRAVLRRAAAAQAGPDSRITVGDLEVDFAGHEVRVGGRLVDLTPTEFSLLGVLVRHAGQTLTRLQLLDGALGEAFDGYERTIDSHIKNLRKKIEADPARPRHILTVYGVGYKLVP